MIIKNISINSFGKLQNFIFNFDRGINIVYGPNEFGKSTVMDFIKLMLYSKPKSPKAGKALREKYTPWDGSVMSGSMEVECGGDVYYVQKEISSKTPSGDKTLFLNKSKGENIKLGKDEEVGYRLLGIDLYCFERSAYIGNTGSIEFCASGRSTSASKDTLTDKIFSNFSDTGEENISKSKILKNITDDMEKLKTPTGRGGSIVKIESEIFETKKQISELDNFEKMQENLRKELKNISDLRGEYKKIEYKLGNINNLNRAGKIENVIKLMQQKHDVECEIKKYGFDLENFEKQMGALGEYRKKLKEADLQLENHQNIIDNSIIDIPKISPEEKDIFESKLKELRIAEDCLASFGSPTEKNFDCLEINELKNNIKKIDDKTKKKKKILCTATILSFFLSVIFAVLGWFFYSGCIVAFLGFMFLGYLFFSQRKSKEKMDLAISDYKLKLRSDVESARKSVNDILLKKHCANVNEYYIAYAKNENVLDLKQKLANITHYRENIISEIQNYFAQNNICLDAKNFESNFENFSKLCEYMQKITEELNYKSQILRLDNLDFQYLKDYCEKLKLKCAGVNLEEDEQKLRTRFEELKNMNLEEKYISTYRLVAIPHKNRKQLESQLEELELKRRKMNDRYCALKIAADTIEEVSDGISKNLAPKLSAISSEIFKNLTSSKYGQVYMQKNYDVLIKDKNIDRPSASFSSGTIDQVYLSLRIAISEIISKKTLPPLLFDDTFIQYDDERLLNALRFLKDYTSKNNSQTIIFTCHNHVKNIESQL